MRSLFIFAFLIVLLSMLGCEGSHSGLDEPNPTALISATPQSGAAPLSVAFNAAGSTADSGIVKYEWDFEGDGIFEQDTAATATTTHTYTTSGPRNPAVRVTALYGKTATASIALMVYDGASPSAAITATPQSGSAPLDVSFSAAGSTASSGIAKYEWDFEGDGVFEQDTATTATATHTYTASGPRNAVVRVTAVNGKTATASTAVMVYDEVEHNDSKETANALSSVSFQNFWGSVGTDETYVGYDGDESDYYVFNAVPGQTVTFTLLYDYPQQPIVMGLYDSNDSYLADFAGDLNGTDTLIYTFRAEDVAPFYLVVSRRMAFDFTGFGDYRLGLLMGAAPVASVTADPMSGAAPLTVNFDASASTDSDGSIVNYIWDFDNDGTTDLDSGATPTAQHTYTTAGLFTASVLVTDDQGLTASAQTGVSVGITYSETEDNEPLANAEALPAFPFTDFMGSIGSGTGYAGFDGDAEDIFSFTAAAGQQASFTLTYQSYYVSLMIELLDNTGQTLTFITTIPGTQTFTTQLDYTFAAEDAGPFALRITSYAGYSDYILEGVLN